MALPGGEAASLRPHPSDFDAWMLAEQGRVHRLCYRLLGQHEEADTATQEIFLKAYRALNGEAARELDDPAKWLTRVTMNTCLDRLRSRRWKFWRGRARPEEERAVLAVTPAQGPTPEDRALAAEISARLFSAIGRLSDRQRSVFVLKHYEALSLEELGEALGLEVGTVKAHMARAVAKLRDELRDLYTRPVRSSARSEV